MSENISLSQAICHAIIGKEETPPNSKDIQQITERLKILEIADYTKFKGHLEKAKESLEEVKKLTEYQDQKVARLLTIIAFLTAAASTIFSRAFEIYPLRQDFNNSWNAGLVISFYVLFAAYLTITSLGALVSFYAMQTRFIWSDQQENSTPKSFLFFRGIASTSSEAWVNAFLNNEGRLPSDSIFAEYYKNYILESYLIAVKIKEKLQYLQPGQRLLQIAIRFLFLWLVSLFLTLAFIPRASIQGNSESSTKSAGLSSVPKTQANDAVAQPARVSSAPSATATPEVNVSASQKGHESK